MSRNSNRKKRRSKTFMNNIKIDFPQCFHRLIYKKYIALTGTVNTYFSTTIYSIHFTVSIRDYCLSDLYLRITRFITVQEKMISNGKESIVLYTRYSKSKPL